MYVEKTSVQIPKHISACYKHKIDTKCESNYGVPYEPNELALFETLTENVIYTNATPRNMRKIKALILEKTHKTCKEFFENILLVQGDNEFN